MIDWVSGVLIDRARLAKASRNGFDAVCLESDGEVLLWEVGMAITGTFNVKSMENEQASKQGRGYIAVHPTSLNGLKTDSLVRVRNVQNGKKTYLMLTTDQTLYGNQVRMDYNKQRRLNIHKQREGKLQIDNKSWPFRVFYWMDYPDERVRVPLMVSVVLAVLSLIVTVVQIIA